MTFDWLQYYFFAQELIGQDPLIAIGKECDNRNAISRAYYAAYNIAKNKRSIVYKNGKFSHALVIEEFKNSSNPIEKHVGDELSRLIADRVAADYFDWKNISDRKAENAVLTAEEILRSLGELK
ncbi:HEPN domain-containing protein [bacterium]|nr:HEPN domain-containing protein [bacterium]